jgi:putative tricarboxylic transport membrane protein
MRGRAWPLGLLAASAAYLAVSLTFPLGTMARPGPGFFPVGVGAFMCVAAAALAVASFRGGAAGAAAPGLAADARGRVAVTVAGLVGFCLLLPWAGYPTCAFLFVALLLRRLGGAGWAGVVLTAALSALLTHYVFAVLLGVPLPTGPLG